MSWSGSVAQLSIALVLENCEIDSAILGSRLSRSNLSFFESLGTGNECSRQKCHYLRFSDLIQLCKFPKNSKIQHRQNFITNFFWNQLSLSVDNPNADWQQINKYYWQTDELISIMRDRWAEVQTHEQICLSNLI